MTCPKPDEHEMPDIKIEPHRNAAPQKRRQRKSRLDPHFLFIAECLLSNSRSQAQERRKQSLEAICFKLKANKKTSVDKSTLCRFIGKHPLLKQL